MKTVFGKFVTACAMTLVIATVAQADLISEFESNPPGTDPSTSDIELSGTPGASFSGFLTFIDTDGGATGSINSSDPVSGTYDASGIAVVTLGFDVENPSYTLVFSSAQPAGDVDADDDDILDDASVFGTVFDAVGIIDSTGDATDYATTLGGVEFATANEFEIVFRDGSTGQFFGVDTFTGQIFDTAGPIFGAFTGGDPRATSFGSVNPSFAGVPEPGTFAVLTACAGLLAVRRRK